MISMLPLLMTDPSLPREVRNALTLSRLSRSPFAAEQLKIAAGRALVRAFGLSWNEVTELLGLWEGPTVLAAA